MSTSPLGVERPAGFDHGHGGHVDDTPHRGRRGQYVRGSGAAQQYGTDGYVMARRRFEQVIGDVGAVETGTDQEIGTAMQGAVRKYCLTRRLVQGAIAM